MERTETQRKILEIGKREFLKKGFKDASLNQIVADTCVTGVSGSGKSSLIIENRAGSRGMQA